MSNFEARIAAVCGNRVTFKMAVSTLRVWGLTLRKHDGEYRVNYHGASEDTAYYTNDLRDAILTAESMKQQGFIR